MIAALNDMAERNSVKNLGKFSAMPRKSVSTSPMGRPRAIYVTPEQLEAMSAALKEASVFLVDSAKFMRENDLARVMLSAAKMMDEHLPAVIAFSRKTFAEVGPAATALQLGRKTRLEHNQERHIKRKTS